MASISELLQQARLTLADSASAARDAEILLCQELACERSYLYTWPDTRVDAAAEKRFLDLVQARAAGTPVAYLSGEREFWSLRFKVTRDTLIPRPETELLVEHVLSHFGEAALEVLDLGTGSGAIAIALGHARPGWKITASDISPACLEVAAYNARQNQVRNVQWLESDWFARLAGQRFDLIVSNPPYIAEQDPHLAEGDVRFEPRSALCSGSDGMTAISHLCQQAARALRPGGWFFCEHGYDQKNAVHQCLAREGFSHIVQRADLGGQPRLSGGQIDT